MMAKILVELSFQEPNLNIEGLWYVNGEGPYQSIQEIKVSAPGTYNITFSSLEGWVSPAEIDVDVESNDIIRLFPTYNIPTGSLRIETSNPIINDKGGR